jgi:cell division ATPase FtsA
MVVISVKNGQILVSNFDGNKELVGNYIFNSENSILENGDILNKSLAIEIFKNIKQKIDTLKFNREVCFNLSSNLLNIRNNYEINIQDIKNRTNISQTYINSILEKNWKDNFEKNEDIINSFIYQYEIDGKTINNAIGLDVIETMNIKTCLVSINKDIFKEIKDIFKEANLYVSNYMIDFLSQKEMLKENQNFKDKEFQLISFFDTYTIVTNYSNGGILQNVIREEVGFNYILNDLIKILRITPKQAIDLVKNYGINLGDDNYSIQIESIGQEHIKVDSFLISKLIFTRLNDLLENLPSFNYTENNIINSLINIKKINTYICGPQISKIKNIVQSIELINGINSQNSSPNTFKNLQFIDLDINNGMKNVLTLTENQQFSLKSIEKEKHNKKIEESFSKIEEPISLKNEQKNSSFDLEHIKLNTKKNSKNILDSISNFVARYI